MLKIFTIISSKIIKLKHYFKFTSVISPTIIPLASSSDDGSKWYTDPTITISLYPVDANAMVYHIQSDTSITSTAIIGTNNGITGNITSSLITVAKEYVHAYATRGTVESIMNTQYYQDSTVSVVDTLPIGGITTISAPNYYGENILLATCGVNPSVTEFYLKKRT